MLSAPTTYHSTVRPSIMSGIKEEHEIMFPAKNMTMLHKFHPVLNAALGQLEIEHFSQRWVVMYNHVLRVSRLYCHSEYFIVGSTLSTAVYCGASQ
jgi:hypothetical protein